VRIPELFGIRDVPSYGIEFIDGANHNLSYGNLTSGVDTDIIIFGSLTLLAVLRPSFPKTFENVVIVNPGRQVVENLEGDTDPSFGNVLIGVKPVDEAGTALLNDVLQNAGPLTEPATDYSNVFFTSLSAGLNMVDIPLKPIAPYTARSLAEELDATVVIRLNAEKQRFEGFTVGNPGSGFTIHGGQGYIVNLKEAKQVAFVGAAWTNTPAIEAAPPIVSRTTAWAFVVSGALLDMPQGVVSVRNESTGAVATSPVDERTGEFSIAWADLSRQSVIQAGDRLALSFSDASGRLVGQIHRQVSINDIQDAYLRVTLRREDILPAQTRLMQNYPNPFNPETWIPYQLEKATTASLTIYDQAGRQIRTLNLGFRAPGFYQSRTEAAYWDGKNEAGESVASGVYFYQLWAGDFSATRRMVILK